MEKKTVETKSLADALTPRQIVEELDKYIIGQFEAKRSVAIALRNRSRRQMLADEMQDEVAPKNIIMIGSTGSVKQKLHDAWHGSLMLHSSRLKHQNILKSVTSDAMLNQ